MSPPRRESCCSMGRTMHDLITPPVVERRAEIPAGTIFTFAGRALRVVRTYGTDAAAPVICEELCDGPRWLRGQYAMWGLFGVSKAMRG